MIADPSSLLEVDSGPRHRPPRSYWRGSLESLASNRIGLGCGILLLALGVVAVLAPQFAALVTHQDPLRQNLSASFAVPSAGHLLGADEFGRDVLTRLIYGTRITLTVASLTILIALSVGTAVGIVAGYYGGLVDNVLMRFVDMVLSIPPILLFIMLSILLAPGPITLAAIIASVAWATVSRLVRAETLSIRNRDFMTATRALGASDVRLMAVHVLPNVLPIMVVAASLAMGQVILAEAALDFLGLGIQPPTPSWGNMLTQADNYFFEAPRLVVYPGATIFVTVLATNLFGNAVRDAFDPRVRN